MVSTVNYFTAPVIENSEKNVIKNALNVLYDGADFKETTLTPENEANGITSIYKADDLGYCVNITTNGYGGELKLLIGINSDLTIKGIEVVSNSETQNIGTKVLEKSNLDKYIGLSSPYNVNAISGATITSKAVKSAVDTASAAVKELVENE